MIETDDNRRLQVIRVLFIALILFLVPIAMLSGPNLLIDLPEFYTPAQMILHGQGAQIYQPDILLPAEKLLFPGGGPVLYVPPLGLPWLLPFGLIPLSIIRVFWWTTLIACVGASLLILQRTFKFAPRALVWFGFYVSVFGAEWEVIKHGQIAPFLLLGISLAALSFRLKKDSLAGFCLSILFLKPQYLFPTAAFLIGARRYKIVLPMVLVAALFLLISWFAIGSEGFNSYSLLMSSSLQNRHYMAPEWGPTIRGQLLLLFPSADQPVLVCASIVLILTCGALFLLGRRFGRSPQWLENWLIISFPLGIVTSLHCHNYDLILLIPAFAAILSKGNFKKLPLAARVVIPLWAVLFIVPIYPKIQYDFLLERIIVWNPFFFSMLALSAAMLSIAFNESGGPVEK